MQLYLRAFGPCFFGGRICIRDSLRGLHGGVCMKVRVAVYCEVQVGLYLRVLHLILQLKLLSRSAFSWDAHSGLGGTLLVSSNF